MKKIMCFFGFHNWKIVFDDIHDGVFPMAYIVKQCDHCHQTREGVIA